MNQQLLYQEYNTYDLNCQIPVSYTHLHELEKKARELGYPKAKLSAQVSAMGFYEKNGFQAYGEEYLDEFCPHIHMEKRL